MKKKIALLLSFVLVLAFGSAACGTDQTQVDYNGYTYDDLYEVAAAAVDQMAGYTQEELLDSLEDLQTNEATYIAEGYATEQTIEFTIEAYQAWADVAYTLGDYVGYEDFNVSKAGSTVTSELTVDFSDGTMDFTLVYDYYDMSYPTGVTISENLPLGRKMAQAGMNTIISLCIVFCVLILISLIIYCFNIFPYLDERKKEKQKAKAKNEEPQVEAVLEERLAAGIQRPAAPAAQASATDDLELVAVIAAAISAATETPVEGFVVRSIRRR